MPRRQEGSRLYIAQNCFELLARWWHKSQNGIGQPWLISKPGITCSNRGIEKRSIFCSERCYEGLLEDTDRSGRNQTWDRLLGVTLARLRLPRSRNRASP